MSDSHVNLQVHDCGLMISPSLSHLGASPYGIVTCNCCGKVVIEMKCPYQCKEHSLKEASQYFNFCLKEMHDSAAAATYRLCENHSYYCQVQLQMKICEYTSTYNKICDHTFNIRRDNIMHNPTSFQQLITLYPPLQEYDEVSINCIVKKLCIITAKKEIGSCF